MKKYILLPLILISACQSKRPIYETSSYELYPDMIVQGEYIGVAETPYRIVSDLYGDTLVWECRNDLSSMPSLETPYLLEEAVYNMALDESINAVEPDGTLRTGLFWGGVWTRDVSYSTILGMAYIQPRAAMTSLLCKIGRNGQIIQDTGTGGAWPCSSDREVWTVAAWELYKVTGDEEWLRTVYPVAKKSLEVDMKTLYDPVTGLVRGESSFIDWREQSYPRWMEPADIYDSKCLGTNVVHYAALVSAAEMASLLEDHEFAGICTDTAAELRKAINEWLWMPEYGYYAQFIAGREDDMLFTRSETLGQALSVIFGVADAQRADVMSQNVPVVDYGTPVFWPWIPDIPPYHNKAIWPFVQAYWMIASARTGNEEGVMHSIGSLIRASAMYATNKENFVADSGDWRGTQINSSNMLWSLSGTLSMTFRVLAGMDFGADVLNFSPVVPKAFDAVRKIGNFRYRNAILDIQVSGYGDQISGFEIDGVPQDDHYVSGALEGRHDVKIVLSNSFRKKMKVNLQSGVCTPMTPETELNAGVLSWKAVEGASEYEVYVSNVKVDQTTELSVVVPDSWRGTMCVVAKNADGQPSFPSEPFFMVDDTVCKQFDPVMLKRESEEFMIEDIDVPEDGLWYLDWVYANGNGDITTDRKCAIRTLYIDGERVDICVFPQRGVDNWQEWGVTSPVAVRLGKGRHTVSLRFEPENDNMHIDTNEFMIRELHLAK